jgi:hypothetical protein
MDDCLDIKREISSLRNRVAILEERLRRRKKIRTCPCKEREEGKCNVNVSYECPFDLAGVSTKTKTY